MIEHISIEDWSEEATVLRDQFIVSNINCISFPKYLLVKPYDYVIEDTLVLGSGYEIIACCDCEFYRDHYQMTAINPKKHIPFCPQCGYWWDRIPVLVEDTLVYWISPHWVILNPWLETKRMYVSLQNNWIIDNTFSQRYTL